MTFFHWNHWNPRPYHQFFSRISSSGRSCALLLTRVWTTANHNEPMRTQRKKQTSRNAGKHRWPGHIWLVEKVAESFLDQSQWVVKYNHCNIEFLSTFNWKFLYMLILTSWRGLTSMTNGSCTCSLSVSDGDGGRTVQPSSIHFVEAKEYVMVFIWRVTENKRKRQRVIMLSGSDKEKNHPFHWRKWAVLEDSTDLNLIILGWKSKAI